MEDTAHGPSPVGWTWRSGLLFLALLALCGCQKKTNPGVLRLGYFPNITHAPALTGVTSGRFGDSLGATRLEARVFYAGPAAIEAMLSGALDATYVGPGPALSGYLRTHGRALRVVSGVASGGVSFVVRPGANIHRPSDLHGKRLATPQLGNTQDIALRHYLSRHGLLTRDRGGDVLLTPMESPFILTQFRLGHLDGAWVPEPWGSRLVSEAGARVFLDERDLWPDRAFAVTLLVVRERYLRDAQPVVRRLVEANAAEVQRLRDSPRRGQLEANRALQSLTGRALPEALLAASWQRIDFTTDPLTSSLRSSARAAQSLGFLPSGDIDGIFAPSAVRPSPSPSPER